MEKIVINETEEKSLKNVLEFLHRVKDHYEDNEADLWQTGNMVVELSNGKTITVYEEDVKSIESLVGLINEII